MLIGNGQGDVLYLNDPLDLSNPECSVCDPLRAEHSPTQALQQKCLLSIIDTPVVHPGLYDALDPSVVCATTLYTVSTAGPPGIDASEWQGLCTSFCAASVEFCCAIALFIRQFCTIFLSLLFLDTSAHCFEQVPRSLAYQSLCGSVIYCSKVSPLCYSR